MNRARREQRRRERAAPSPEGADAPRGCAAALAVYLLVMAAGFYFSAHRAWVFAGAPAVIAAVIWLRHVLQEKALLREMRRHWEPRGIRCLVVYSDSPLWRDHVHAHWLPRLRPIAEVLNWSERATWKPSLPVRLFGHFCGREEFNPAVVVFRVGERPLVFRFFQAFREAKAGDGQFVVALERQMFAALLSPAPHARATGG